MKCIICGKEAGAFGNNPAPLTEVGRCCDKCNTKYVIPIRLCLSSRTTDLEGLLFNALNEMSQHIYDENKEDYDDDD